MYDDDIWFFRPDPRDVIVHGTWSYGDSTADVCVVRADLRPFAVLVGRPGHPGQYHHPFVDYFFETIDEAMKFAEAKLSLTWDDVPPPCGPAQAQLRDEPVDETQRNPSRARKATG